MADLIDRQEAIDTLNVDAELLRRVLDDADIVGAERANYEWGLGLIESYISDMKELPSADVVEVVRCKDCRYGHMFFDVINGTTDSWIECRNPDGLNRDTSEDSFCSCGEQNG